MQPLPQLQQARRDFLTLVARLRPDLHRYCARMVGSVIDGEDVVQDTLARAYYELSGLKAAPALRAWLFRIAHNRALDCLRRHERRMSEPLDPDTHDFIDEMRNVRRIVDRLRSKWSHERLHKRTHHASARDPCVAGAKHALALSILDEAYKFFAERGPPAKTCLIDFGTAGFTNQRVSQTAAAERPRCESADCASKPRCSAAAAVHNSCNLGQTLAAGTQLGREVGQARSEPFPFHPLLALLKPRGY